MTRVTVTPGNCGFSVVVAADKGREKKVELTIDTECGMVLAMLEDIPTLEIRDIFKRHISNPVYRSAAKRLEHAACPVPVAILKAAEAELGLCLPEDIAIEFEKIEKRSRRR